jgi:hypothetical protein
VADASGARAEAVVIGADAVQIAPDMGMEGVDEIVTVAAPAEAVTSTCGSGRWRR